MMQGVCVIRLAGVELILFVDNVLRMWLCVVGRVQF